MVQPSGERVLLKEPQWKSSTERVSLRVICRPQHQAICKQGQTVLAKRWLPNTVATAATRTALETNAIRLILEPVSTSTSVAWPTLAFAFQMSASQKLQQFFDGENDPDRSGPYWHYSRRSKVYKCWTAVLTVLTRDFRDALGCEVIRKQLNHLKRIKYSKWIHY